jgi:hypothetical protein
LVWEKINQFGNTHILKTNALGSGKNPKALRFEYRNEIILLVLVLSCCIKTNALL